MSNLDRKKRLRIKLKAKGKLKRPRLSIFCSLQHVYAQVIDDVKGITLVSASSLELKLENGGNVEAAKKVGALIAKKAEEAGVKEVVFDRGGRKYHGRVAALATEAREKLEF